MIKYILAIICVLLPFVSYAKDAKKTEVSKAPKTAELRISEADCDKLSKLGKKENKYISAEYTPGIDVYGKKVVPADANEYAIKPPKDIKLDISIDIAKKYGLDSDGIDLGKIELGTIEIKGDKAYINSHQMSDDDIANIVNKCE